MTLGPRTQETDDDQQDPQAQQAEVELAHELGVVDQDAQAVGGDRRRHGAEHRERRQLHHIAGDAQDDVRQALDALPAPVCARSPIAAQATPKKIENTTICRISLSTIGRTAEFGKTCLTKPSSVMACASMPGADAADDFVDADARLEQVDQDQAERQRHQRGADEPQHRLAADPPDRAGVGHVADADDQRGEHQRRDDHLDQPQEDRAADARCSRRTVSGWPGRRTPCGSGRRWRSPAPSR